MDLVSKEYKKRSDFIPSPPTTGRADGDLANLNFSKSAGGKFDFLKFGAIAGFVLLILSLAVWGGLKFYQSSINNKIEDLKKQQSGIFTPQDKEMAEKIANLEKRAELAQQFLKSHVYTSEILNSIAALTLPKVKWDSYELSVKDKTVKLNCKAADYSVLAKQLFVFNEAGNVGFSKINASGIALDKDGTVGFAISFEFDPKIIQKP